MLSWTGKMAWWIKCFTTSTRTWVWTLEKPHIQARSLEIYLSSGKRETGWATRQPASPALAWGLGQWETLSPEQKMMTVSEEWHLILTSGFDLYLQMATLRRPLVALWEHHPSHMVSCFPRVTACHHSEWRWSLFGSCSQWSIATSHASHSDRPRTGGPCHAEPPRK